MNALVYAPSGGGKTVNSTLVAAPNRGRNLLMCSDNSQVVLNNFQRKNLDILVVKRWVKEQKNPNDAEYFAALFDKAVESKKYDNIIVDNLSDMFDMAIIELADISTSRDRRQDYQLVYQELKRLVRKAGQLDCNVIFTAWHDMTEITLPSGEKAVRLSPKLPAKILDNICGLCNIVAYIQTAEKDGQKLWFYRLEGNELLYAKDQLYCRKACKPEDLFIKREDKQ